MIKNNNRKKSEDNFSVQRVRLLSLLIILCGGVVFFQLYSLQIRAYDHYKEKAQNQYLVKRNLEPDRGEIFIKDQEGLYPVAVNKNMPTAYAIPDMIKEGEEEELAEKIAEALDLEKEDIIKKLLKKGDLYEPLKRKLTEEEVAGVKEIKHEAVKLQEEDWRYYPGGDLASQLVGFVGYKDHSRVGIYGIEKAFQEELEGSSGYLRQEKDISDNWISIGERVLRPSQDGSDLVLSVDYAIQHKVETVLEKAVEKHDADGGRVIIMEPHSGKILSMAQFPDFDLNKYSEEEKVSVFRNSLVSDTYECGSVFKTFTMAAGLDSGEVGYDETYVDTGRVKEAGYTIKNSEEKVYGEQTMTQVIENSINTGVIYVEKKLGNKRFYDYVKRFGFGEPTGIDLPGEIGGNLSNLDYNRDIDYYTASFGQGITVTPLQLVSAYSAVANGGELIKPSPVDYIIKPDGSKKELKKDIKRKVISRDAANKTGLMLESNVREGHGTTAGVPGYRVAGKTGTAQISDKEKGGYEEDATVGSFAGFAPVDNPRFAMLVVIDNPKDVEWAESTAGPVFGELAKFMFDYYGIEPTEDFTSEDLKTFDEKHEYLRSFSKEKKKEEEKDEIEDDKEDEVN
ncbi:MAG: peptidoglycan D,D-transpeptidase FtsI family protein [Patescibacteria group bacterium]